MAGTERQREIRRRRKRREKVRALSERAPRANAAERTEIIRKLRRMTTGADVVIERLGISAS